MLRKCVVDRGNKPVCVPHLSALSAVYDFLLVRPASRPAVLNEYGLLIEPTGAMKGDGIGRAVNFDAFNAQLHHFFETTLSLPQEEVFLVLGWCASHNQRAETHFPTLWVEVSHQCVE